MKQSQRSCWHPLRPALAAALFLFCAGLILFSAAQAAPLNYTFQGLGDLTGGGFQSKAYGVSADGTVVVGYGVPASGQFNAFRWTSATGMVSLGSLAGGSTAYGVSADGNVVVGQSGRLPGYGYGEAFRWTQSGGMVGLGDLPGGSFDSIAYGTSANGSVVVGKGSEYFISPRAFRWTLTTPPQAPMVGLAPNTAGYTSTAYGFSADGSVVVGFGGKASGIGEACRWTEAGVMVLLGDLTGGDFGSVARGVSADGTVVVGRGRSFFNGNNVNEAFLWTESVGMVGLGDLAGGSFNSEALGVSADGKVVVGYGYPGSLREAFIWDAGHGMRNLKSVLTAAGLNLDWRLDEATGISADGRTIVGFGLNPSGKIEAWRVTVVPLPGAMLLLGTGLAGLAAHARRAAGRKSR